MGKEGQKKALVELNVGDMSISGKKLNLELEKRIHSKSRLSISVDDEDSKKKEKPFKKRESEVTSHGEKKYTEKEYRELRSKKMKDSVKKANKKVSKFLKDVINS